VRTPTKLPIPSGFPTSLPSASTVASNTASGYPTSEPSFVPSRGPSESPSKFPSRVPSLVPTNIPSVFPRNAPSGTPSMFPSSFPTAQIACDFSVIGIPLDGYVQSSDGNSVILNPFVQESSTVRLQQGQQYKRRSYAYTYGGQQVTFGLPPRFWTFLIAFALLVSRHPLVDSSPFVTWRRSWNMVIASCYPRCHSKLGSRCQWATGWLELALYTWLHEFLRHPRCFLFPASRCSRR
jgi:hypothetical protein